jgi:rubredoxin
VRVFVLGLLLMLTGAWVAAEEPYGDISDLKVSKPEDKMDAPSVPPPSGAIVLFDGKSLDGWVHRDGKTPAKWMLLDLDKGGKVVQVAPKTSDIITKQKFDGAFKLHVEFRVPYEPKNKGQGRGNSGVYLQGRYEVQVLDSYGIEKPGEGDCGGIYGIAKPKANACKAPTVWQTYDIDFTAPECKDGKKVKNGRITVLHNGVKIHDNVEITKDVTTAGLASDPCTPGPILLQDHGNPVQFRNIWLLPAK